MIARRLGRSELGLFASRAYLRKAGRLHFENVPLPAVLRAIGRWYDLDVRIAGPALATRSITAEFTLGAPDEMLRALALAVDARLTRSGAGGRIITLGGTP